MKMAKMWWIKGPTKNAYFRDGINPDLCEVLKKEEEIERRKQRARRRLVALKVRVRFLNTKS
jgi:hypothetical protein